MDEMTLDQRRALAIMEMRKRKAEAEASAPQESAAPMPWSDVPGEALSNLPKSAGNFVSGIYQSIRHPIDTGSALLEAGQGAAVNLMPDAYIRMLNKLQPGLADKRRDVSAKADAIGGFYKDRYGNEEGFKNAIATDPVGIASDLSAVLSGGATLAPKASGLANILNTGAKSTNPVNALTGVGGKTLTALSDKVMKPAARSVMQSALKPTIKQLQTGKAATAIDTLFDYGVSPSQRGVEKLRGLVDGINNQVKSKIAGSNAMIGKDEILPYLDGNFANARSQVSPMQDVSAIQGVADDFMNHPSLPNNMFPVQVAQDMKRGTYQAIRKSYGQRANADIEAQKSLARGLKDKISERAPEVKNLNIEEKRLLDTLDVAERRALMELNKNPVGLSALAGNPVGFAAFMADRSAAFKSLAARMLNRTAAVPKTMGTGLLGVPQGAATSANLMSQAGLLNSDQR